MHTLKRLLYYKAGTILFFFFVFSSLLWAEEAPIVDFNRNMPLGACQELKVLNAREGTTYTFELISGLGTLSGTTYCAPTTIAGPEERPVIRVTAVTGAQALSSSQALVSRASKPLTKATPVAASSGTSTDINIGLYPQDNGWQPYVTFVQTCTQDHKDNPNISPCYAPCCRTACCWEIIQYKCDGSMRDIDPDLNGACCEPKNTPNCGPSCANLAAIYAANYPYYYNVQCYPNPESPVPPDVQPQGCPVPVPTDLGNPVSILDGAKKETEHDLTLGDLAFTRYYNSFIGDTYTVLGQRWNHSFNVALTAVTNMAFDLKIKEPDGRGLYYKVVSGTSNYVGLYTETSTVTADPTGYTWFKTDGANYRFNLNGHLTGITESNGTTKTLAYDANNRLTSVTDNSSNRAITFEYDSSQRITQIKGPITTSVPDGIYVKFQYDGWKLKDVIYPDNSGFLYLYTNSSFPNHLTEKRDRSGRVLATWTYDSKGRAITDQTLDGRSYTITYGQGMQANEVTVTDAYSQSKKYILTRSGGIKRLLETTSQNGCSTCGSDVKRYSYDANHNIIQKKYANDRVDQYYDFDNRGNPAMIIEAYGTSEQRIIERTYHPRLNRPLIETIASSLGTGTKQTIYDYDNDSNTTPNENPTNLVYRQIEKGFTKDQSGAVLAYEYITTYTYNSKGQILSIDGPKAGTADQVTYAYSTNGDLQSITQPLIGTTTYDQYDAAGLVGRITDPNGLAVTMTYDARGHIKTRTTTANNAVITYNYNATGDIASVTDAMGITMTYTYETTYGKLEKITNPLGDYLKYTYDSQGNRQEQGYYTPSDIRTYQMRYNYQYPDQPGKLWKVINPDDTYTEYSYDNMGNIASIRDPKGQVTTYQYDLFNRLKSVIQPGNILTYYTYDSHANLITVTDAKNTTTTYVYDDLGRVLATISPDTNTTRYTYNAAGNLTSKTDANNISVTYAYDGLSRLTAAHFPDSSQDITYTYDQGTYAKGRLSSLTDPAGQTTYVYDILGRLITETRVMGGISYMTGYQYDLNNNLIRMTYPSGLVVDYQRDASSGRITSTKANQETVTHAAAYYPFGPLQYLTFGTNTLIQQRTYDQNYWLNQINAGTQLTYTYTRDANGNVQNIQGIPYPYLSGVSNQYQYNTTSNKLLTVSGTQPAQYSYDNNGNTLSDGTRTYIYNQDNRLIRVTIGSTIIAEYGYDGYGRRVKKVASGTITVYHYDLAGNLIFESMADGTALRDIIYQDGERIALKEYGAQAGTYYYLNDHLGTPQKMVDSQGQVVWQAAYLPFGEASVLVNTIENNFRFPGQYYDAETGLHYNYHRYYDPRTGRYITADPIGLRGGINLFRYVGNNPINKIDALGLQEINILPGIIREIVKAFGEEMAGTIGEVSIGGLAGWYCAAKHCKAKRPPGKDMYYGLVGECLTILVKEFKVLPGTPPYSGDIAFECAEVCEKIVKSKDYKKNCLCDK